jgi:hypothetical protein
MKTSELCGYFFQSIKLQKEKGPSPDLLEQNSSVAILFAKEEVSVDPIAHQIHLPGLGPVEIDVKSDEVPDFDWAAILKNPKDDIWNIILGCGNPYLASTDQGLPIVNGAVIAVPACLSPVFKE